MGELDLNEPGGEVAGDIHFVLEESLKVASGDAAEKFTFNRSYIERSWFEYRAHEF